MNPFAALPLDIQTMIAVYSWVGMIVFAALGLYEVDKARRKPAAPTFVAAPVTSTFAWFHCPNGHCKILAAQPKTCPVCQAAMTGHEEQAAFWRAQEAA